MSFQAMQRHRGNLSAYYEVKETNLKSIYMLYNSNYMTIWEKQEYGDSKKISDCWGLGESEEVTFRRNTEDFL